MATVAAIFTGAFGPVSGDQTDSTKGPFLMDHNRKIPQGSRHSMYSDGRYCEDYYEYEERD